MANVLRMLPALLIALLAFTGARAQDDAAITSSERAKMNTTRETMRALAQDLRAHMQSKDRDYPKELKELVPTVRESLPKDAWGNEFTYEKIDAGGESDYRLTSTGADSKKGGAGAAADIVFTKAGELRELSTDQKAARDKRREEAKFHAHLVIARQKMTMIGGLVVNHRREKKAWPQTLQEVQPKGTSDEDKAMATCFTDPWGKEYELRLLPKDNLAIVCWGADGKAGGKDRDADFVITEKEIRATGGSDRSSSWRWRGMGGGGDWQVYNLADSVKTYQRQRGALPAALDDLLRGGDKPGQNPIRAEVPRDKWGNEFAYVVYGPEEFYIVALGKDGIQGGKGDDADTVTPQPGRFERDDESEPEMGPPEEDKDALRAEIALEQVKDIAEKLGEYKKEKGSYADSLETIKDKFPDETIPIDPWGNAYVLTLTKNDKGEVTGFTVKSLGGDGAEGGKGTDGDLVINEKGEQIDKPTPGEEDGHGEDKDDEAPKAVPAAPAVPVK